MGTTQGICTWVIALVMRRSGWGDIFGYVVDVFLGGTGQEKRSSRVRVPEKFSQDERSPNSPVCVMYYMLSSGGFAAV